MQRFPLVIAAFTAAIGAPLLAPGTDAIAQGSLSQRIAQAPDGVVRMEYPSRSGACGDGKDVIGFRRALFANSFESYGRWSGVHCVPGPVRVSLTVEHGRPTRVSTSIGDHWVTTAARVTDLGIVSPTEAAAYFYAASPSLASDNGKDRSLLPAVLANDPGAIVQLATIARADARPVNVRRQAVRWIGLIGDEKVVPLLLELVQPKVATADDPGDDDDEHAGARGLRDIAISALGSLQYGAGVPALIDLSKHGAPGIRHTSVFWLGQTGDARALAALHEVIENEREESRVRAHAIFSLAHGDGTPEVELAWLRSLYPRLHDDKLKDAILMGESQDERDGGRWLLGRVRDGQESMHLRKQALFWAGQRKATPTADLVAAFRDITDQDLREHAIFVLSQRNDEAATSALIGIARSDRDRRMRSRALFWLAQKHDARVTKLISDLVTQ